MQYGQIVFLLFIAFLFYYAVLIVLDILKGKDGTGSRTGESYRSKK